MNRMRILSLDGGGVRGAYCAGVLAAVEKARGAPLAQYFDLIVGSSTGGILALGLALGFGAAGLCEFYRKEAKRIFPRTGIFSGLFGTKYKTEPLRMVLKEYFKERRLKEATTRVVVTSYNASRDGPHLFKTNHHVGLHRHEEFMVADLALATAAAPVYFAGLKLPLGSAGEEQVFLDGGVWANAPVVVGIAEALRFLGAPISNIHMLSVGTGYSPFSLAEKQLRGGTWQWAASLSPPIISLLFGAQQAGAVGTARTLLQERFYRVQRVLERDIAMDDPGAVEELIAAGTEDGRHEAGKIAQYFCDTATTPFVPSVFQGES